MISQKVLSYLTKKPATASTNVLVFPLRKEASTSGEKKSYEFIINSFLKRNDINLIELTSSSEHIKSFSSFFSMSRMACLKEICDENVADAIIVKIPTGSQLFFIKLLTKNFKGRLILVCDGLMWSTPSLKTFTSFLFYEPFMTLSRLILNNRFWVYFASMFHFDIIVASDMQKKQLVDILGNKSQIKVIPNSCDGLLPLESNKAKSEVLRFGYIGHSYLCKGLLVLLDAIELLRERGIPCEFVFAISSRGSESVTRRVRKLGCHIAGDIKVEEFYSGIDFLVAPYLVDWGTNVFPSVLLESLFYQIPVVTSKLRITEELFKVENSAIFCKPNCHVSLADSIESIVSGRVPLPLKEQLYELFNQRFSPELVCKQWDSVINNLTREITNERH